MSSVSASDVRAFLVDRYGEALSARGVDGSALPDDFDFLTQGVIDSFGILEMISAMEEKFGFELDYEAIDPQDLTLVGPLSRFVEEQTSGHAGQEG